MDQTTKQTLAIFWRYTQRYRGFFWSGTGGVVLAVIFQDIIPPFIVSRAFAKLQIASAQNHAIDLHQMTPYLVTFGISMLLGLIFWRIQGFATWLYEIKAIRDIITDIFGKLVTQGQRFHADRFGGSLVSQSNKFVGAYERLMDELTWSILPAITVVTASSIILFIVAWKFAVILLSVVAIYMVIMTKRIRHQFPYNRREAEADTMRTGALADAITNTATIRAFAQEDFELKNFRKVADKAYNTYYALSVEQFKNDSISHTMTNSLRVVALVFGIVAVVNWHSNVSVLYLVIAYASSTVDLLWRFGRIMRNINRSLGDAAEMTEILQLEPEIRDPKKPESLRITTGAIDFNHVSFGHNGAGDPLFKDLSLHIKPGEKIGLVGQSGGGKTTLTRLLLRFMDIDGGTITIDGQNIAHITQADLRSAITYVPQEPMLFHRSLAENIRYGNLEASDDEIKQVAKMAHADEFISKLSHGYDTLVGERGVKLSGGQRQRVAIARAMLKKVPILVLDEATSALDSESEVLIQDALWKLMEGRTAIVIAHRLSTIQKMDRIIVLDDGRIAEQGTHKQLLAKSGVYAKLWSHQSGGFIED